MTRDEARLKSGAAKLDCTLKTDVDQSCCARQTQPS